MMFKGGKFLNRSGLVTRYFTFSFNWMFSRKLNQYRSFHTTKIKIEPTRSIKFLSTGQIDKFPLVKSRETIDYVGEHFDYSPTRVEKINARAIAKLTNDISRGWSEVLAQNQAWSDVEHITIKNLLVHKAGDLGRLLPRDYAPEWISFEEIPARLLEASETGDLELLLSCANSARIHSLDGIADLPLLRMNSTAQRDYQILLDEYGKARSSTSQIVKLNYLEMVKRSVLPKLWDDVSYFQAMSMLLSYLHLEADPLDIRIPFTPHIFSLTGPEHRLRLKATKELALTDWILQTGGKDSGVKIKVWVGLDSRGEQSGLYIADCMGTNSVGPHRDKMYAKKGVVTGALADRDPKGIAFSAYQEMSPFTKRLLQKYVSPDSLIINIGHSLGASVAAHNHYSLLAAGYENTYLLGFNGGAISHEISEEMQAHSLQHVLLVHNEKDVVQYGGSHLPPGTHQTYPFQIPGTIGPWNPIYGRQNDPIYHGDMQHLGAIFCGVPPRYQSFSTAEMRKFFLHRMNDVLASWFPGFRGSLITTVLKPDPTEWERDQLSYTARSDAPKRLPFKRDEAK